MDFDVVSTNELELTDAELESVFGGGAVAAASAADFQRVSIHSYAVICDIDIFSLNLNVITVSLLNILSPRTQVCINND